MRRKELKKEEAIAQMGDLFGPLTEEQHQLLSDSMALHTYKRGEVIFEEGARPFSLFCLLVGKVKVYKTGASDRHPIIAVYKAVQYFGYRSYFAGQKYSTSAAAFEKCTVATLPLKVFTSVVRNNAELGWYFIRSLSTQLELIGERAVNLTQKHVRGRLAESLLFLKNSYGLEADNCTLSIYLTREDIACLSNMTTSNAIRTLSQFATEKLIIIDGRKIKVIDEEALEKISQMG